jgi:hypothetical protein
VAANVVSRTAAGASTSSSDRREYLAAAREVGAAYRALIGDHYPAMSAVQVGALMEERAGRD